MKNGAGAARLLLRLLFVLPERPLKAGESVERTIPITFHAGGSVVSVDARGSTTLTGYVDVDGRTCARLYTDVRARKPDVSVGKATYRCDARVRVVSYFDVAGRRLVSAHLMLEKGVRPGKSSGAFAMLTRRP